MYYGCQKFGRIGNEYISLRYKGLIQYTTMMYSLAHAANTNFSLNFFFYVDKLGPVTEKFGSHSLCNKDFNVTIEILFICHKNNYYAIPSVFIPPTDSCIFCKKNSIWWLLSHAKSQKASKRERPLFLFTRPQNPPKKCTSRWRVSLWSGKKC